MARMFIGLLSALAFLVPAPSVGAESEPPEGGEGAMGCGGLIVLEGHYRFRVTGLNAFDIDTEGTPAGQEVIGEQRLRLKPYVSFADTVFIRAQADLFAGQIFGDTTPVGARFLLRPRDRLDGLTGFDARHLWLEWRAPFGRVLVGQMGSQWGLGMLANDGADRDLLFGDRHHGDIVERVAIIVPPLALFSDEDWARQLLLAAAFDVVFRDENADLLDGDLALQGAFSLRYRSPSWTAGAYVVYRDQEDDDGAELQVTAVDVFARVRIPLDDDGMALELAAEAVAVVGETNRAVVERARKGMDVLGFGALFRLALHWPDAGLYPALEVGFASGDNDRGDDVNRAFSFDPDHRVGLILFDQVLPRMSARAAGII